MYPTVSARNPRPAPLLRGLDLAPHQALEDARVVEGLDGTEASDRAVVDEDVGYRLAVGALPELLERRACRRAVRHFDDLDTILPAREEASGAPAAQGSLADVKDHSPLLLIGSSLLSLSRAQEWSQRLRTRRITQLR